MRHFFVVLVLLGWTLVTVSLTTSYTAFPMLSRRIPYARTQYRVPCKVCTMGLLAERARPSHSSKEFEKNAPLLCGKVTTQRFEQEACTALFRRHSRELVKGQRRGDYVHTLCIHTEQTDCAQAEYRYSILCDRRSKTNDCHVIPTYP